jgi:site-specific recombinase XerD
MIEVNLDDFQAWMEEQDKAAHTVTGYLAGVRHFAQWFVARLKETFSPVAVTPLDIKEYRDDLAQQGFSPNTINQRLSALTAFFSWAQTQGWVEVSPTLNIKQVSVQKSGPRWLDRREQYALKRELQKAAQLAELRATRALAGSAREGDPEHYAIWRERRNTALITLMLNAGLRVSEVAALTIKDLVINERSGHVVMRSLPGSGKRKHRQVPLNADARRELRAWLEVRSADDTDALFVGQRGDPLSSRAIQRVVAKCAEKAGLKGVTPHILRHTCGHNLVGAGVSLDRVATILGHERLDTTAIYTRPSEKELQEEVEKIAFE